MATDRTPDPADVDALPEVTRYYPICDTCVAGVGQECHTPECALWMRDVPPDGLIEAFGVDLAERDAAMRAEGAATALREAADDGGMPREYQLAVARLEGAAAVLRDLADGLVERNHGDAIRAALDRAEETPPLLREEADR